jgi:hypothetical protein
MYGFGSLFLGQVAEPLVMQEIALTDARGRVGPLFIG